LGFARGQSDLPQRYGISQSAEMKMDLYRVDLSAVVSKYIGETEKNLLKVFETARAKEVILFCDKANSLFGKRTENRNSHDR
jgi:SpoVK/Ycf46/Vps4 family AAA+-type ATPase